MATITKTTQRKKEEEKYVGTPGPYRVGDSGAAAAAYKDEYGNIKEVTPGTGAPLTEGLDTGAAGNQLASQLGGAIRNVAQGVTQKVQQGMAANPPSLSDQYMQYAQELLDQVKNSRFNYDQNVDPYYLQARDAAMRQADKNARNVQANAAKLSGGYGNSYGAMAAGQAYNAAMQDLNAIVPDLEQNAYNRYLNDRNRDLTLSQIYLDLENQQYGRDTYAEERDYTRKMNEAAAAAELGDFSKFADMGFNVSSAEELQAAKVKAAQLQNDMLQRNIDSSVLADLLTEAAATGDYSKVGDYTGLDVTIPENMAALQLTGAQLGVEGQQIANEGARLDNQLREVNIKLANQEYDINEWNRDLQTAISTGSWTEFGKKYNVDVSTATAREKLKTAMEKAQLTAQKLSNTLARKNISMADLNIMITKAEASGDWSEVGKETGLDCSNAQAQADLKTAAMQAQYDQMVGEYELANAMQAAQYGDYSFLKKLGIDTTAYEHRESMEDEARKLDIALTKAKTGDFSALENMGVDTKRLQEQWDRQAYAEELELAINAAAQGDFKPLKKLGIDTSNAEYKLMWEFAAGAADAGDYSMLKKLGIDTSFLELKKQAQMAGFLDTGSSTPGGQTYKKKKDDDGDDDTPEKDPPEKDQPKGITDVIKEKLGVTVTGTTRGGYIGVDEDGKKWRIIIDSATGKMQVEEVK